MSRLGRQAVGAAEVDLPGPRQEWQSVRDLTGKRSGLVKQGRNFRNAGRRRSFSPALLGVVAVMTLLPGPATGQEDLSGAELDRALAEAMRKPPPPLADWSDPVDPLAEALAREGRWSDAAAFYGRYPPGSREAALALLRLSELTEWESDDFDDLPVLRESLAILAGLGEPDDPDLVYASQAYSAALRQSGLDTDAIIESYRAVLGPDHPLTAQALQAESRWAGFDDAGLERVEQSEADCRSTAAEVLELQLEALEIARRTLAPDDYDLILPLWSAADAQTHAGASAEAAHLFGEAARISALYEDPLSSTYLLTELASVTATLAHWNDALVASSQAVQMLDEAVAQGQLTEELHASLIYRVYRALGDAERGNDNAAAANSAYAAAAVESPLVDCFQPRHDGGPRYVWVCRGVSQWTLCDAPSLLEEVRFLEDRAQLLASGMRRSREATRLSWFASEAVVSDTRERHAIERRGQSDFSRYSDIHRTFVSTAWRAAVGP